MRYRRREDVEAEQAEAEDTELNSSHRRAALNQAVGMGPRNPWAFQLSEGELQQAEQDVRDGNPPVPIWTEPNGLRILADPLRVARRQAKSTISLVRE